MDLPFLHIMLLPKPPSGDLQNALSIIMVFHTVLLLTKELISQPEKCDSGRTTIESTGFYHVFNHPEATGLIERQHGLFKMQLQCQLHGNSMEGWGRVLQNDLNQRLTYSTVSPIARIHGSRDEGMEKGIVPLTITLSDPLGQFLLPVPTTVGSAGLEVLVPEWGVLYQEPQQTFH